MNNKNNKSMDEKRKKEIATLIDSYLDEKATSQNKIAKRIGVNPATISNIRKQYWHLISDEMLRKVEAFLGGAPDRVNGWKIVDTPNFQLVQKLCHDAQDNSRMMALTGESGFGKTTALKYFNRHNRQTYYTLCNFIMNRKDFLLAIADSIGISTGGRLEQVLTDIVDYLVMQANPLLILDDAGKLVDANFRMIQLIFDRTEGRCGIIISGTNYLKTNIDRQCEKDRMGFRELKRRVEYWQALQSPDINTVHAICVQQGLGDKEAVNYVYRSAKNYGTMKALITNARRVAKGDEISIDVLSKVNVS